MTLLDASGKPVTLSAAAPAAQAGGKCPSCGAPAKDVQSTGAGFGGFWQKLCQRCGHVLGEGRETVPEVI